MVVPFGRVCSGISSFIGVLCQWIAQGESLLKSVIGAGKSCAYSHPMSGNTSNQLRRGWTTGACATAATKAALQGLWGGEIPAEIGITLPRGETPVFAVIDGAVGAGFAQCAVVKDAGDDPDVTHGALIQVHVCSSRGGVVFRAGSGVGMITKAGLPLPVGEPAINAVPRQMMGKVVAELAKVYGREPDVEITVSIPGGEALAAKTWNPRLGIKGGLSILGTTGIVRPFSCSAWIASIHRGIDVALAAGEEMIAGCTGSTSEAAVRAEFGLPEHAMIDMGDFAGGMLKYLRKHPIKRVIIGGGIGKITKLAQGAIDLHSSRSQVDIAVLAQVAKAAGLADVTKANTALEALEIAGILLAQLLAEQALENVRGLLSRAEVKPVVVIVDRAGGIIAQAGDV